MMAETTPGRGVSWIGAVSFPWGVNRLGGGRFVTMSETFLRRGTKIIGDKKEFSSPNLYH